jgi:hypothetical protein
MKCADCHYAECRYAVVVPTVSLVLFLVRVINAIDISPVLKLLQYWTRCNQVPRVFATSVLFHLLLIFDGMFGAFLIDESLRQPLLIIATNP